MSSSLRSQCVARRGVEECWDVRESLEPQTWPGPVMHAPCHLWRNTGCFSLKAICFPPTYCVRPQKSLPLKKCLVISLVSQASCLLSLSLDLVPSQKHICCSPMESTAEISALPSLELKKE